MTDKDGVCFDRLGKAEIALVGMQDKGDDALEEVHAAFASVYVD